MNTNLLLVTNVPKSLKPQDLLKELENKWARVIFIDNPYFELYDAFVYNPTNLLTHFELGVKNLRDKVINGATPLKVYYLWFPPPNVLLTKMIPANSTMLPFLFVDNLPKECDYFELVGDLPFQSNEIKSWDIPQKEDKWMVLRLPMNQDSSIRDYVLKFIRTRRLSNGLFPRVLEVFATKDNRLSTIMMQKVMDFLPITSSYKSNLLFLYDLPTNLTIQTITESAKSLNVKGTKTFFLDLFNGLRCGFIHIPRSLPDLRFNVFHEQLKEQEIMLDNQHPIYLNINEVWLQPQGAEAPLGSGLKENDKVVEYVLTNYVYIHNVAACANFLQLTQKSPVNFKAYLFKLADNMTQVGFVCLKDFSNEDIGKIIQHLRSLNFDGFQVMVDNIYVKCYDLPENNSERRDVHVPRVLPTKLELQMIKKEATVGENYEMPIVEPFVCKKEMVEEDVVVSSTKTKSKIEIAKAPPSSHNLLKSDFIYVNKLPNDCETSLFSYLNIEEKAITVMSSGDHKAALIYYPDTVAATWLEVLENIATSRVRGHFVEVSEVYLQSDESNHLIHCPLPGIKPSRYIFVYNISDSSDTTKLDEHANVVRFSTMDTESGSCAFVELVDCLSSEETIETLNYIRSITLDGACLCADLIWLANVKVNQGDKNAMRNRWLKKPEQQQEQEQEDQPESKRIKLNNNNDD